MFLTRLVIRDFKNIREAELRFSEKVNCIWGSNGAGKTNLLDAIYYLSMTKSFFSQSDRFVATFGSEGSSLCGYYRMDDGTEEKIVATVGTDGDKTFRRGVKAYTRFSEHIGLIPVVMVSPVDSCLINDSGDERRKYMNFILSQTDREYLKHVQSYNQLLMQRNKLLKSETPQEMLLETFSERMEPHASYIHQARRNLCRELLPMMQEYYTRLSGGAEQVSLSYRSDLDEAPLTDVLHREAQKERILRYTTAGVQRDDMLFELDGHSIRRCGSQGQQKSFLLSMKLAQFLFIKNIYSRNPILLLDDVFDKLDMKRVESLLNIVSADDFGQIFVTDCNKVRMSDMISGLKSAGSCHSVENGLFSRV